MYTVRAAADRSRLSPRASGAVPHVTLSVAAEAAVAAGPPETESHCNSSNGSSNL
jgi:hypothetical protein